MFVAGIYLMDSKVKFLLAVRADETCRVVSPAKRGHLKDVFLTSVLGGPLRWEHLNKWQKLCGRGTPTFAMRYIYNCGSKSSLSVQVWMWTSMQLDMEIDMNINAISVSINCVFEINLSWQDWMWTCGAAGKGGRSWGLRQKQSCQKIPDFGRVGN